MNLTLQQCHLLHNMESVQLSRSLQMPPTDSEWLQVVIAASIVFFKTPASATNIIGTSVALGGVFAYSLIKRTVRDRQDFESVRQACLTAKHQH